MVSRQQRDRLELLSAELFGVSSKWTKVLKDPGLQVVVGTEEVPVRYNAIQHKNRKFTVVKAKDEVMEKKPVTREMTLDELEIALTASLEMKNFAGLFAKNEIELYETVAKRYKDDSLMNMPYLVVKAEERADFDALVADIPEAQRTEIMEYVVPQANKSRFSVDGTRFATELVYLYSGEKKEEIVPS
jgi:thymidylate synthase ThyX